MSHQFCWLLPLNLAADLPGMPCRLGPPDAAKTFGAKGSLYLMEFAMYPRRFPLYQTTLDRSPVEPRHPSTLSSALQIIIPAFKIPPSHHASAKELKMAPGTRSRSALLSYFTARSRLLFCALSPSCALSLPLHRAPFTYSSFYHLHVTEWHMIQTLHSRLATMTICLTTMTICVTMTTWMVLAKRRTWTRTTRK